MSRSIEPFRNFKEKKTAHFRVYCSPGDTRLFEEFFGSNELSRTARNAMLDLVRRKQRVFWKIVVKKKNKFFPTYEAHQYINEGRIWFQKNPIHRWDTSQRELWEILARTLWRVSKQSRMGIWRNNTKWLNLLSGVLPSVLKLQGFQCSFHPNQIRPSSSSYKTCFTGQGFSTGQFHRHWWFVAVEIHGNQNKEYIIAEQRAGNDCKRTFPSTPGSLLLALSKESFTFQATDVIAGKVAMTAVSNQSRTRSGTVSTAKRVRCDYVILQMS